MEKLKSVFNPGSKADEDVLYGEGNSSNLGKVSGEGSHFGHSRTTDPSGATSDSAKAQTTDPAVDASKTAFSNASAQQSTPSSATQAPSSDATKAAQAASKPQTQDVQSQSSVSPLDTQNTPAGLAASRADANRHDNTLPDRSTTAAGTSSTESQKPHPIYDEFTSGDSNPYSSHTVDPRVDPSATSQPKASHTGRDVALGGASAGAAAYEGNKLHDEHKGFEKQSTPQSNQFTSSPATTTSKPIPSAPSQPTNPTPATYDAQGTQGIPSTATSQAPGAASSTSQTPQQSQSAGTGYYVAPHGTAVDNEKPAEKHSNLGRDAAIGAGAGSIGVGGYEAMKSHDGAADQARSTAPISNIQHTGASPTGYDAQRAPVDTSTPSVSHPSQQQQPAGGYYTQPNTQSQSPPAQHHYGRNTAAAAGTGAAGVGAYEALHDRENKTQATPQVPSDNQQSTQASQAPHVQAGGVPGQAITTDSRQPAPAGQPREAEHHYGRDAAIGAGAGAAGIGGYEALKHHEASSQPSGVPSANQQSARAAEPTASQATAPIQSHPTATQEQKPSEHHYGRDAAIGAGAVGAGGATAYEAKKHEEEKKALEEQQKQQKEAEAAEKAHEKELKKQEKQHEKEVKKEEKQQEKEAKKAEKEHEKEVKKAEKQHEKEVKKEEKQHEKEVKAAEAEQAKQAKKEEKEHEKEVKAAEAEKEKQAQEQERLQEEERKRREKEAAAAAAGVGAAGLGAEEYERRKGKDSDDEKDEKKKGGILGLFHRDKKDKDKDAEDEHHGDKHHKGEEAAAGAGAVGAAGLGAHELDKHKENEQPQRTGSTATDDSSSKKKGGLLSGILHRNKHDKDSVDEKPDEKSDEHHYGRDAAIGAGAVGAGALGKHEYDEYKDHQPAATAGNTQATTDTPSATNGTQQQQQDSHHHGKEAAAGAGVLGAGALGKHEYDSRREAPQDSMPAQTTTQTASTILPPQSQTPRDLPTQDSSDKPQHHYKEEAAAGAGFAGAGLLGKHEYDKHQQETPQGTSTTAQPTSTSEPQEQLAVSKDDTTRPHRKEEAAAATAGTAGAGALGKHELDKHSHPSEGQDLGVTQGQVNEHYRHPKTEADIAAEKRNDIPVLGQIHREGHFHGTGGGAPGAVGLPPEERDQAYIESQKQAHTEHKKPGLLDKILHRHKDDDTTTEESGSSHHEGRNRLHKDPPSDHPAANTTIDPVTGLPMDTSKGPHTGAGTDGLPHGQHSENISDNKAANF